MLTTKDTKHAKRNCHENARAHRYQPSASSLGALAIHKAAGHDPGMGVSTNETRHLMNEQNPAIPPIEAAPLPPCKDRSTGLMVFGILSLLLGCLVGLFVPLMLFGQMMAAKAPNE